jgi:hypothetical protein
MHIFAGWNVFNKITVQLYLYMHIFAGYREIEKDLDSDGEEDFSGKKNPFSPEPSKAVIGIWYVCIYIYICLCINTYVYLSTYVYILIYIWLYVLIYIWKYILV